MFDTIYVHLWYWVLLFIVFMTKNTPLSSLQRRNQTAFNALCVFSLLYIGLRPISPLFGDMVGYAKYYNYSVSFATMEFESKDFGFQMLTQFLLLFKNVTLYFFVIACLYLVPIFVVLRKEFKNNSYLALLIFLTSFSFMGYGTNGLRNGMATSLVIAALFTQHHWIKYLLFVLAISFHQSVMLPVAVYFAGLIFKSPKNYIYLWIVSIPLSVLTHGFVEQYLSMFDLGDQSNRLNEYMTSSLEDTGASFSRTGFRWDFLMYSAVPIAVGRYFIIEKHFDDKLYQTLFNLYVGCNIFWVLVMYVPYSNRFAYLSWFLYPIVISYPLLKETYTFPSQSKWIKNVVLYHYLFTFLMFLR